MKLTGRIYQILIKIWKILPCKKQIALFLRFLRISNKKFYKDIKFKGTFNVKISGKKFVLNHFYSTTIENEIFWKGFMKSWEEKTLKIWGELADISNVIFDVGANTGIFSVYANCINPDAKIFAFEPCKRVYDRLFENKKVNNHNNLNCYELAVSDIDGEAVLYDLKNDDNPYTASLSKDKSQIPDRIIERKVQVCSLKSFIEKNKISHIDLMKIDVEMNEPQVLEGMGKYLQIFIPSMIIEISNDEIGKQIKKLTSGMRYLYFYIDEEKGLIKTEEIKLRQYQNYLICTEETAKKINLPV